MENLTLYVTIVHITLAIISTVTLIATNLTLKMTDNLKITSNLETIRVLAASTLLLNIVTLLQTFVSSI